MHVAEQLYSDAFAARCDGASVDSADVLPDWSDLDRFGVVVDQPLGALGASLLLQLAIARFYEIRPRRRDATPTYPEIYLFHVGGPFGDFSHFDFWPPRKELHLPNNDPRSLLASLNAHAITRLALPTGVTGDIGVFDDAPSTWAEQGSAVDRLRSVYLYDPGGRAPGGTVELTSCDPRVTENFHAALDPLAGARQLSATLAAGAQPSLPGASRAEDLTRWAVRVFDRVGELDDAEARRAIGMHGKRLAAEGGVLTEVYQRVDIAHALARIAALGAVDRYPSCR